MKDYLFILLLVAPGFLARGITSDISSKGESKSEFDKTIVSLLYSLPINIINLIILRYRYGYTNINDIYNKFSQIQFILKYVGLTISITILFAVILELFNKYILLLLINKVRSLLGNEKKSLNYCGWDEFFQFSKEQKNKAIKIIKGKEEITKGFVKNSTYSNDDNREIILEYGDIIDTHIECFDLIEKEYYNANLDLRIQEYNLDSFTKKQNNTNNA